MTTRHSERRVLPYAPAQLYDLVADVARYPEFLPWCKAARIRRREGANVDIAELAIGFGPFHEKFTSRVVRTPDAPDGPRIDTTGTEGPFRRLASRWRFQPHPSGCMVEFELEFDFRSMLLQKTVQVLFAEAVKRMVGAFEGRARQLYGGPSVRPGTPITSMQ
ncbi:MAG: type II toxin-antitoxin system RatA family toxin [Pseudomonadota bacterium]